MFIVLKIPYLTIKMPNNKSTLLKANTPITQGDYEGFLQHCTEDTLWTFVGDTTLRGKEAVRQWMAENYIEPPVFEVEQLIAGDDHVIAMGKITVRDKKGNLITSSYCDVWRFENGKMAELNAYVVAH
ncbi:nuclear transport factor 2 family protein [uncultured Flavobacterium sp.]|uniref:nuclear transport factor 2 family protein n=1 Tax=uncultured Flavobacterium sp. TaxID=165435 RepID=UPI0025DB75F1|nr:nuclear transport factor 2 family protein [uncultured Flavobacterium sp.]